MKKNKLKNAEPLEQEQVPGQEPDAEAAPEQSRGKKITNAVINTILVIAIVIAALATYTSYVSTSGNGVPSIFGIRILSIQTESMYPTLKPGDMIFDTAVTDTSQLRAGDVITYWTVIDGERVLNTHRITEIYDGGGYLIFETKGDNNTVSDALTVHESEVIGQFNGARIGGLGKVFDYLQTSTGFLIVIVIPVALFFIYHLVQFFRILFEYNNVKSKLLYEMERGKTEDLVEDEKKKHEELRRQEREILEQELRMKLREELNAAKVPQEEPKQETPEEMEARIRAEMEAEAKAKAEAEARAAMEAEIRAKIKAEMEADAKNAEAEPEPAEKEADEPERTDGSETQKEDDHQ